MRILFVAMPHSVHTGRWIRQLADKGHDLHLFPSMEGSTHPLLKDVTVHCNGGLVRQFSRGARAAKRHLDNLNPVLLRWASFGFDRAYWLARVIRRIQPDIVHSLEIQHGGYATLGAREQLRGEFPTWIVTNWGSDIYLFGRLDAHIDRIKAVLASCDFYSCECRRDVELARSFGFKGQVLPVLPNTGGYNLEQTRQLRQPGPVSDRRLILVKGYQNWAGRSLVALQALRLAAENLKGYEVAVYSAKEDVAIAAELLSKSLVIPIHTVPPCSHDDMLRLFGRARVAVSLSISDAISTALLEAMVMGAFPIQSCTACADEWIKDGATGFIVPPEDPEAVAVAVRRALSDDALVDWAAEENARVTAERLDRSVIEPQVVAMYETVATHFKTKGLKR